ncbi:MAG TPA: FliH/SctL family protein [Rhizomicrobium sp.]|jgi:flagellar assembly protein FliH
MNATKFTFDTVFRSDREPRERVRAPVRRMYSESEVETLIGAARIEGATEGDAKALDSISAAARDVADAMRQTFARASQDIETLRAESSALALALARKIAGAALESFPVAEVERALREAMHQAIGEPRIVVRAAPEVAVNLAPRIAEIAHDEGYEGRVQLSEDPALSRADCRIEWRGGGADRAEAAIMASLDELISRRFQGATRGVEE